MIRHRFFTENIDETAEISGNEAHHLVNVMRKKVGDVLFLFDGKGNEYEAKIEKISGLEISLKIISKTKKDTDPKVKINLFQSIPKLTKFDFVVEKTTEIGVSKIIPVISERTQASWLKDTDCADRKIKRWQKIALAASKQCGRTLIPEISNITTFHDAVKSIHSCSSRCVSIIPWECEQKTTLKQLLATRHFLLATNLFIGPEGGFSNDEIEFAKKCGIIPVSLGKRILRTETAPIVVISNILYELDNGVG